MVNCKELKFPMPVGSVFQVEVVDQSSFAGDRWPGCPIYQLKNIYSNVIEGEAFSLARIMLQARASEMSISRLQKDEMYDHELLAMENMFDELDRDNDIKIN